MKIFITLLSLLAFSNSIYSQKFSCETQEPANLVTPDFVNGTEKRPLNANKVFSVTLWVVVDNSTDTAAHRVAELGKLQEYQDSLNFVSQEMKDIGFSFNICDIKVIQDEKYLVLEDDLDGDINLYQREKIKHFYTENTINIYLIKEFKANSESNGQASFPGDALEHVTIAKDSWERRTLSHELGHFFGLYHTFSTANGNEFVFDRTDCATTGDLLCDTPADHQFINSSGCTKSDQTQKISESDGKSYAYLPSTGNIMSYYPKECNTGFTKGQLLRMVNVYYNTPSRYNLK